MKAMRTSDFLLAAILLAMAPSSSQAQETNFAGLVKRVVAVSANVKPGEVVVVFGGKHTVPLMEELAIEIQKAGGLPTMLLGSGRVTRSFYLDVPEKYLEQEPRYFAEWLKHMNVWIGISAYEDPKAVFADIPETRFAKAAEADQYITDRLNESGLRLVFIGYPTRELAAVNKLDFATYEKMHWDAVNADYKRISEKGQELKRVLQGAKKVRVTSPAGTDVTFSVGGRPVFVDDGIVTDEEAKAKLFLVRFASLPGGEVVVAPVETSANGRVVVPKHRCRFAPMTGISFDLKNGQLQNFQARENGKCFEETLAPYAGPKDMFGSFSIGLNPALRVIEEGGDYRPGNAAGLVWIIIGDNQMLGGNNKTQVGFGFPIVNGTVEIDGKVVVKDGKLL